MPGQLEASQGFTTLLVGLSLGAMCGFFWRGVLMVVERALF